MSIPGAGNPLLLGGAGSYKIERSIRLNASDSAFFSRTPASAGNRKTWTWAGWVKRSTLTTASRQMVFTGHSSFNAFIGFATDDKFEVATSDGSSANYLATSDAVFRDTSAWMHIVVAIDTPQASTSNRARLWVNGVQQTLTGSFIPQNGDTSINLASAHRIGSNTSGGLDFSGYLADIHLIDGQALTPSSFGETDANGIWQPKAYSGSYGTNGFHLDFADNSAATATTLGKDTSPNGNNWTPNNLSVTAGAGNDSLVDSPTNYGTDTGAGGEVRGNYATLNPLNKGSNVTLLNGNLDFSYSAAGGVVTSTFPIPDGKWYWEFSNPATYALVGCYQSGGLSLSYLGSGGVSFGFTDGGFLAQSGVTAPTGSIVLGSGDVAGFAFDTSAGTCSVYKNGTLALSYTGLTGTWYPAVGQNSAGSGSFNFGQRSFAYTAPSGFKALCTQNLPTPTITKPSTVMDALTWTGTSANQTVSGLNFNPDLIWIKIRSDGKNHAIQDSVRGFTTLSKLSSAGNFAEGDTGNMPDWAGYVNGATSTGFTLTKNGTGADDWVHTNKTGNTYVGWCWDAGSSTVTNTSGTISSQVRANASAGFSIVTAGYFSGTVGHGLGVAPAMVIVKTRNVANNWYVYHKDSAASGTVANNSYLIMNSTGAVTNAGSNIWNVTSTTVSSNQGLTDTGVYYCFAPVAGYSAFGSYTGNGSADGPFVYTGFRPRYVMVKSSSTGGTGYDWIIKDTERDTINTVTNFLIANGAQQENYRSDSTLITDLYFDFLSNGFKVRTNRAAVNGSTVTFIYAAFAEAPFALARAR